MINRIGSHADLLAFDMSQKNILRASASRYTIQHNNKLAEYSGAKVASRSIINGATRRFANRDMLNLLRGPGNDRVLIHRPLQRYPLHGQIFRVILRAH
jgi:hypothetical protein